MPDTIWSHFSYKCDKILTLATPSFLYLAVLLKMYLSTYFKCSQMDSSLIISFKSFIWNFLRIHPLFKGYSKSFFSSVMHFRCSVSVHQMNVHFQPCCSRLHINGIWRRLCAKAGYLASLLKICPKAFNWQMRKE